MRVDKNRGLGRRERAQVFVSLFEGYSNPVPTGEVNLAEFLLSSTYKEAVEAIRRCPDKHRRRELKSKLPAITPSGIFSKRCNAGLIEHSGFICIDIDGQDNAGISDWEALKLSLSDMPGLWYAGLSASGEGLFLLFKVKYPQKHLEYFHALARDLSERGIVVDQACKDVARLRGASYDPEPFYNPGAVPYEGLLSLAQQSPSTPLSKTDTNIDTSDLTAYRVGRLIETIESTGADIADYYPDWYAIGRALASKFGQSGREWFHIVSSKSPKYKPQECDMQYNRCLKTCSQTSIRTFFWYCKQYGITAKNSEDVFDLP